MKSNMPALSSIAASEGGLDHRPSVEGAEIAGAEASEETDELRPATLRDVHFAGGGQRKCPRQASAAPAGASKLPGGEEGFALPMYSAYDAAAKPAPTASCTS